VPTSLLPHFLTSTLGAPAAALGLIEGLADGVAGLMRLLGGALADDPRRRRNAAIGGYAKTALLTALIGAAQAVWQVGLLRTGGWAARGLRVPSRNALLADAVPSESYGRAYWFERAMDNLGAVGAPLLALILVAAFPCGWHLVVGHPGAAGGGGNPLCHPPPSSAARPGAPADQDHRQASDAGTTRTVDGGRRSF